MSEEMLSAEFKAILILAVLVSAWIAVIAVNCRHSVSGWRGYLLWCINRLFLGWGFHVRMNRRCPFPETGGALIVANHRAPLDPMFLWQNNHLRAEGTGRFRIIRFLMAAEYYDIHPVVGFICRAMRSIPIARDGKDMGPVREAARLMRGGDLVGIFPEGGINTGPGLRPADTGVGWLALSADVPVIPVCILNAPQAGSMVAAFVKFQPVRVRYGEPIDLSAYRGRRKTRELLEEVTLKIMYAIGELGQFDMRDYRCLCPSLNGKTATSG